MIHIAFNINPPVDIASLWLAGVEHITAARIRIRICALLWAIWNCRNDMIFNIKHNLTFLQVIFRATAWIRTWSLLTPMDSREPLVTGCNQWEMVARVIFNRFGWRLHNRIGVYRACPYYQRTGCICPLLFSSPLCFVSAPFASCKTFLLLLFGYLIKGPHASS